MQESNLIDPLIPATGTGKAFGVVYKTKQNPTNLGTTVIGSVGVYYLVVTGLSFLSAGSTPHFTSTGAGDLVYSGPTRWFRFYVRTDQFGGFVAAQLSVAINTIQEANLVARMVTQTYAEGNSAAFMVQLSDGDSVRLMTTNESSTSNFVTDGFYMELAEI